MLLFSAFNLSFAVFTLAIWRMVEGIKKENKTWWKSANALNMHFHDFRCTLIHFILVLLHLCCYMQHQQQYACWLFVLHVHSESILIYFEHSFWMSSGSNNQRWLRWQQRQRQHQFTIAIPFENVGKSYFIDGWGWSMSI